MNRWMMGWTFMLLMSVPCWAQEEEKQETLVEGEVEEVTSPILRLAEMRLDEYLVPARVIDIPLPGRTQSLQDVLDRFEAWSEDDNVGGVLLDVGFLSLSLPDLQELRMGIDRLKSHNKKVMAFLNAGGPTAYLLACSADEIAIAPTGNVMIPGLGRLFPFMQGYYQMMGYEFDVISAGRFKYPGFLNAREPNTYFLEEFGAILDGWFGDYKQIIASSRGLSDEQVGELIDIALFDANDAQQRGLVDTLSYYDDYRERVLRRTKMKRYRGDENAWANVKSIQDIFELINREMQKTEEARKAVGPKIAILHARGPIIDMSFGAALASQVISRDDFVKVVDDIRKNDSIKAVVMRIDSPGGSGYASDVIWKHLRELADAKPLVVSMGTVAGSGGYYIACPAHRIFAQPTTITGSIGVLGIFQSAWSALNRMDYEVHEMKRGARSTLGSFHRTLVKEDRQFLQDYIDDFYEVFLDRVATTRRMPVDEVRKIAEGRIYTGRQALKIGLVDELGGMEEAIESARTMANIPPSAELKILHYPRPSSLGELLESFSLVGVSAEGLVESFTKGMSPAQPWTFDQQLFHFSQRLQPLCWMGIPNFYSPEPNGFPFAGPSPMPNSIERIGAAGIN